MALELKISESAAYDRENHVATFSDDTGVYAGGTNEGGYGSPNPERSEFALVVSSIRINNKLETVKIGANPLTDALFNFDFINDQVSDIYLCAIPFESNPIDIQSFPDGYVFYYVDENEIYKVIDREGTKVIETTSDVVNNSLHLSAPLKYQVSSYSEKKKRDFYCDEIISCEMNSEWDLSEEYKDLNKSLDAAKCYFEEGYYLQADNTYLFMNKIEK